MWMCKTHGEIDTEYCEICDNIISCDCSNITSQRIKDIYLDMDKGGKLVTINIHYCTCCGTVYNIVQK